MSTWRNNLWFELHPGSEGRERTDESYDFFKSTSKSIDKILESSRVTVACDENDPEFIYGYSVIQDHVLIWVYVKIEYRGNKIAKLLSKDAQEIGEPTTKAGHDVKKKLEKYITRKRADSTRSLGPKVSAPGHSENRICEVPTTLPSGKQNGASL
jgi:hypothetical protein